MNVVKPHAICALAAPLNIVLCGFKYIPLLLSSERI